MGLAVRLVVAVLVAAPALTRAACEPSAQGLVVAVMDGRLHVAATAPNSPAALGGIMVGDVVLQVNAARPTTCAAWRVAVMAAARDEVDLLVLVEQSGRRRVVAVAAPRNVTARREAAADPDGQPDPSGAGPHDLAAVPASGAAGTAAPEAGPPRRRTQPLDLLPDAVPVTRSDVIALIGELGGDGRVQFRAYSDAVVEVRRALSTLLVRDPGTADADMLLRIVRRHEGAVIAWDAVEAIRRRQGLRASIPVSVGATESYFSGSQVAALTDEIPALARAVRVAPSHGRIEVAGLWEPMRARGLLWAEADELFDELVGRRQRD